jgi:hypothetical protein
MAAISAQMDARQIIMETAWATVQALGHNADPKEQRHWALATFSAVSGAVRWRWADSRIAP